MEQPGFLALSRLSEGNYKAFLYDCDGTLTDNMPAHTATYVETAKEQGVVFDPAMINELAGWPIVRVVEEINRRYGASLVPEDFKARKAQIYAQRYLDYVKPIEHVVAHLKANAGKIKIGVVSGGDRPAIQRTLQVLGIDHLVEVLVCAEDTEKGKPFADPFLKAAALLDVPAQDCLVFEDGIPGVEAAKAAGMHWIRVDQMNFG